MRRSISRTAIVGSVTAALLMALLVVGSASPSKRLPVTRSQSAPPIAFVGVTIVPMDRERIIENQTVLVRDGRIAEIGPSSKVKVPAGPETIDGKGKYLMPGLAEMHGHLPGPNQGDQFGTIEVGKRADMILLNENPLKDVGNVWKRAGVMVRGRWLSESEIQSMLEKIAGGQ